MHGVSSTSTAARHGCRRPQSSARLPASRQQDTSSTFWLLCDVESGVRGQWSAVAVQGAMPGFEEAQQLPCLRTQARAADRAG